MALLRGRRHNAGPPADSGVPVHTPIAEAVARRPVRVVGSVVRMRARPTSGQPSLAVTVSDDTGSVVAVWTGRRAIGGITLGRRVVLDGVPRTVGDRLEFVNPAYTLLAP